MDIDWQLKRDFRRLFPEYHARMSACESEEQAFSEYNTIMNECSQAVRTALAKDDGTFAADYGDAMDQILLTPEKYKDIISSTGDSIKYTIQELISGLMMLKKYEESSDLMAAGLIITGAIALGAMGIEIAFEVLQAEERTFKAALAAIKSTKTAIIAIVSVVIIAILIPILYFMSKPAACVMLLLNETNEDIEFVDSYNVHGKPDVFTRSINKMKSVKSENYYNVGIYTTTKINSALFGTQYGVRLKSKTSNQEFLFGVECPLTTMYTGNNCWCGFTGSAEEIAKKSAEENKQSHSMTGDVYKIEIKCNSSAGSAAYYIARIIKVNG